MVSRMTEPWSPKVQHQGLQRNRAMVSKDTASRSPEEQRHGLQKYSLMVCRGTEPQGLWGMLKRVVLQRQVCCLIKSQMQIPPPQVYSGSDTETSTELGGYCPPPPHPQHSLMNTAHFPCIRNPAFPPPHAAHPARPILPVKLPGPDHTNWEAALENAPFPAATGPVF